MVRYREPAAPPTVAIDARSGGAAHGARARPEVEDGADNEEVPEAVARDPELAAGAVNAEPDWGAAPMAQPATRTADAAAPIKRGMTRFMPCRRAPVPAGWRYREASLGRAHGGPRPPVGVASLAALRVCAADKLRHAGAMDGRLSTDELAEAIEALPRAS